MGSQKTTEQALSDILERQGEHHYDFSEFEYVNAHTKVKIWCNIHKEYFYITPNHLMSGKGCRKCGRAKAAKTKTKSHKFMADKLNKRHVGMFTLVKYTRTQHERCKFRCNISGEEFWSFYDSLYTGRTSCQCNSCLIYNREVQQWEKYFKYIFKAITTNETYSEYDIEYGQDSDGNIRARCPVHGWRKPKLATPANGHKCRKCALKDQKYLGGFGDKEEYLRENPDLGNAEGFLYFVEVKSTNGRTFCKVGITQRDSPRHRLAGIKCTKGVESVTPILILKSSNLNCYSLEQEILAEVADVDYVFPAKGFCGRKETFSIEHYDNVRSKLLQLTEEDDRFKLYQTGETLCGLPD